MPLHLRNISCHIPNDRHCLRINGWKKLFQEKINKKQACVAILIPDKVDFKPNTIGRDKEGHFILINRKSNERLLQF